MRSRPRGSGSTRSRKHPDQRKPSLRSRKENPRGRWNRPLPGPAAGPMSRTLSARLLNRRLYSPKGILHVAAKTAQSPEAGRRSRKGPRHAGLHEIRHALPRRADHRARRSLQCHLCQRALHHRRSLAIPDPRNLARRPLSRRAIRRPASGWRQAVHVVSNVVRGKDVRRADRHRRLVGLRGWHCVPPHRPNPPQLSRAHAAKDAVLEQVNQSLEAPHIHPLPTRLQVSHRSESSLRLHRTLARLARILSPESNRLGSSPTRLDRPPRDQEICPAQPHPPKPAEPPRSPEKHQAARARVRCLRPADSPTRRVPHPSRILRRVGHHRVPSFSFSHQGERQNSPTWSPPRRTEPWVSVRNNPAAPEGRARHEIRCNPIPRIEHPTGGRTDKKNAQKRHIFNALRSYPVPIEPLPQIPCSIDCNPSPQYATL